MGISGLRLAVGLLSVPRLPVAWLLIAGLGLLIAGLGLLIAGLGLLVSRLLRLLRRLRRLIAGLRRRVLWRLIGRDGATGGRGGLVARRRRRGRVAIGHCAPPLPWGSSRR